VTKLPRDVPGDRLVRALARIGWYRDHQVGGHATLRHPEKPGKKVVVPVHPGKALKPKTLLPAEFLAGGVPATVWSAVVGQR